MKFFHFPSEFVYWQPVNNHEKLKSELLPLIQAENEKTKNNPFTSSKINTSFYHNVNISEKNNFLHDDKYLKDIILDPLLNMQKKYNDLNIWISDDIYDSIIRNIWWNVYEEGDFKEGHKHNGEPLFHEDKLFYPSFSAVYILHDENETTDDFVFKKEGPLPFKRPFDTCIFSTDKHDKIKEGSVLIFPYNLEHHSMPCKKGRVTIAFEIYSTHTGKILNTTYQDIQNK